MSNRSMIKRLMKDNKPQRPVQAVIDEELFLKAKKELKKRGITFKELVEMAVNDFLSEAKRK